MDFTAEEELCEQAYEVWLSYACPACSGDRSASPPNRRLPTRSLSSCDGPCSVLPLGFDAGVAFEPSRAAAASLQPHLRRQ